MKPHTTPVDENKLSQMKLIFHEIQTIYDAGTPLFTKDNIREVGKQLQRFQKGERDGGNTILKGVNGIDYEVFIEPRSRDPPRENEHVGGSKWIIIYSSIKHLTTYIDVPFFNLQSAYLPMRIVAPIALLSNRPEYTKPPAPPAPPAEDFGTYQALEREWRTSQHYERLQEMLATIVFPFTLTKVIGLALGALVIRSQVCESTVLQHALVSALHSTLVQRGILSASSKQYVQDPIYTQRDREILHSAGLTVLDDPQALLDLDESSVLVCINPNIPIRDIVADICRPGIIIWNKSRKSFPSSRVKQMIENEYIENEFPEHKSFGDLVVLIRKST